MFELDEEEKNELKKFIGIMLFIINSIVGFIIGIVFFVLMLSYLFNSKWIMAIIILILGIILECTSSLVLWFLARKLRKECNVNVNDWF